ncbi:hypothetical protein CAOG_006429 [Capsaspora owczarzaki ATCC 30864]|uniref:Hexosyltransferase n=2 Tax=Capsaspora owczarzaki (strain ATCC 30864) TaxID=595528 RepID=A0A0D2ULU3_CAPO3|nr:hypothetical protein CAOG_006429 [Capsaspora owczarzaki ATCC 30864]
MDQQDRSAAEDSNQANGIVPEAARKEPINVMISSDAQTVMGVPTLIQSIFAQTPEPERVVFYIAVGSDTELLRLQRWISLSFWQYSESQFVLKVFPVEWVANKIKIRGRRTELASPANYARYYVLDLFPGISKRVIYLDTDVIVRGDIAEFYKFPLGPDKIAAFAQDCSRNKYKFFINFENAKVQALNIDPDTCSFNAGVYVTDLVRWKKHNITSELEYWMELNTRENVYGGQGSGGGSQPPVLLALFGHVVDLDPKWHVRHLGWHGSNSYQKEYVDEAKLLHWNGQGKPWLRKTVGVANFVHKWREFCVPEPPLADDACTLQAEGEIDAIYVSDQVLDPFDCASLREDYQTQLSDNIALDCKFPVEVPDER